MNVQGFLDKLDHPRKPEMIRLREVLLAIDPAIGEKIKWNAPSFRTREHFATMRRSIAPQRGVARMYGTVALLSADMFSRR